MKKNDLTFPSADGRTTIYATEWVPDEAPRAVLQIAHGMVEYVGRYDAFASWLAGRGFYVVGNDHIGHGRSVVTDDDHGYFGHPGGNGFVISDMNELREITSEKYPDIPYFFLGHSMGSFLLSQYITMYGAGLAGAIIMGTGVQPGAVLTAGKTLCRTIALSKGWRHRSSMVNNIAFGSYNKAFEPARTPTDWLTRDENIVDAYNSDPWCTFMFTVNGYYEMFAGIEQAQKPANIKRIPKDLPILLISGQEDPVGEQGKGVEKKYETYKKAGIEDVSLKLYPKDRHEILNELDKSKVYSDLLDWMEQRMAK